MEDSLNYELYANLFLLLVSSSNNNNNTTTAVFISTSSCNYCAHTYTYAAFLCCCSGRWLLANACTTTYEAISQFPYYLLTVCLVSLFEGVLYCLMVVWFVFRLYYQIASRVVSVDAVSIVTRGKFIHTLRYATQLKKYASPAQPNYRVCTTDSLEARAYTAAHAETVGFQGLHKAAAFC